MRAFSPKTKRVLGRVFLAVLVIAAGWCAWKFWLRPWIYKPSPLVLTPKVGLEPLQAKSLYYTSDARKELLAFRPDLLAEDDHTEAPSLRANGYAQATQDTGLFEALNVRYQFDTLLLLGDISTFQHLLQYLLEQQQQPETRKFQLVYMDHWMLVFKRAPVKPWAVEDLEQVKAKLTELHSDDRARFYAKTAQRLLAVGYTDVAKQWLDRAISDDSSSPDALAGLAGYYCTKRQWKEAEKYGEQALAESPNFAPALQQMYTIYAGMTPPHMIDAYKVHSRLLKIYPDTPGLLLQNASVAFNAHEYRAAIASLTRYIQLAEAQGRDVGHRYFELGMFYATLAFESRTDVDLSVDRTAENLRKGLVSNALSPEERDRALTTLRKAVQEQAKRKK